MATTKIKRICALFLVLMISISLFSCADTSKVPEAAKGTVADQKNIGSTDAEKGTVYFGMLKGDYVNNTSENSVCYKFDGVYSAVDGAAEKHNGESIILAFQNNALTDPTLTPHPVDSEDHFKYLKAVVDSLRGDGADTGSPCAFTLSLEADGKETAVYTFRCDKTVEIKRGNEKKYSSVDEETFMHIAMLCAIYTPYNTFGNALMLRGSGSDLSDAADYKLVITSGGKSKELGAEAAAELAGEYFGGDKAAMTFAPVVNVEYDFEKDGYISFRETYKLGGTEYEKQFWLGADGKVYNITKNTLSSKMIVLSEGSEYIEFTGSALRVNRSQENYDYAAVKALLDK